MYTEYKSYNFKYYTIESIKEKRRKYSIYSYFFFIYFQDIYRHAFLFLGSVLHLKHEFPLPKEIFSGSMWTVLYALSSTPERSSKFEKESLIKL